MYSVYKNPQKDVDTVIISEHGNTTFVAGMNLGALKYKKSEVRLVFHFDQ